MAERSVCQLLRDLREWLLGRWPRESHESGVRDPAVDGRRPRDRASDGPITLKRDLTWIDSDKMPLDPHLRVALALLEQGDPQQVLDRTGIRLPDARKVREQVVILQLPVHIELAERLTETLRERLSGMGLKLPNAYVAEAERNEDLRSVTGQIELDFRGRGVEIEGLRKRLRMIIDDPIIRRIALPAPLLPCDAEPMETLKDFGLPADRTITIDGNDFQADGKGVVIGIIDDGCSFAQWNFLRDGPASRVIAIWDQGRQTPSGAWQPVQDFGYGCELLNVASGIGPGPLDAALLKHTTAGVVNEDAVYNEIDFRPYATLEGRAFNPSTHGTHVMDVAAGSDRALFGRLGVAPEADIIFVQLPPGLVAAGGAILTKLVREGAQYIFDRVAKRAADLNVPIPAVVNISYGNYTGPHDGTSPTETGFDQLLAEPDRAIVIAAGNGFAAQCHATGRITKTTPARLEWQVPACDESMNIMETWYTGPADLELYVTPPGGTRQGPVTAGNTRYNLMNPQGKAVGYVDHLGKSPDNGDQQIVITLNATSDGTTPLAPPRPGIASSAATAPPGTWFVELVKPKVARVNVYHAWIERDEARKRESVRRVQSRFADGQAEPRFTVTGIATGRRTIAVGAYNTATHEMAEYSACGPTRPSSKQPIARQKPELCAPSAADSRGRGVLSAETRFALSTRMGGTSVSAPHVAGLAALALQLNRDLGNPPLPVADLRTILREGAEAGAQLPGAARLRPNLHQAVDTHQPLKQRLSYVWNRLVGAGRANAWETLKRF